MKEFNAFVVDVTGEKEVSRSVKNVTLKEPEENDVLINVHYSSLNYKDALSANGNRGVTKNYPHTPGIDAVGTVVSSGSSEFKENDKVIVTSYDLGMNTAGGFGEYICVPSEWVLKLPEEMSMQESMIYGTAGLTAGMSVKRLVENIKPSDGPVVVTGASGGVGSIAVAILSKLGYTVSAVTGKSSESEFLLSLGASEVIPRSEFDSEQARIILKGVYAGAVDTVGGVILENILKSAKPMGVVTCCGNAASHRLNTTVFPFIIRGISLIGIDSQNCSMDIRKDVWNKLAGEWKPSSLLELCKEISFNELDENIELMLEGKSKGRTVLNLKL